MERLDWTNVGFVPTVGIPKLRKAQTFPKTGLIQFSDKFPVLTGVLGCSLGNAFSWQSVTRKWKQKLKNIDLFQRWLDSSKNAKIVVNFYIPVNDKTVFPSFSCNVSFFLLLSWFVTLLQFCKVSTGKVNFYDEVWNVFLWKVLFLSFPLSDPHAKKTVNKFLLTSGSWYFRVEKCCPQFWRTLFFKLTFSQKQRRHFFYRSFISCPLHVESDAKKTDIFSCPLEL